MRTTPDEMGTDAMNEILHAELELDCPACGQTISFSISDVGSSVVCPHCNETITLEAE